MTAVLTAIWNARGLVPWVLAALAIGWGLWERADYYSLKAADAAAIKKASDHAESLANELVIEQAKAMAVTTKTETVYVDRLKLAPDDRQRNRVGTLGVRDIVNGALAAPDTAPPAMPGPSPSPGR